MSKQENRVNWRLAIRAALILAAVGLALFGVFSFDRVDCRICWKDVTRHYFAFFGYFAAFGFAIGWTLPDRQADTSGTLVQWDTRQGFWEGSLGVGALITIAAAAMLVLA